MTDRYHPYSQYQLTGFPSLLIGAYVLIAFGCDCTLMNEVPLEIEQDQRKQYIADKVVKLVEQGDGYDYIYHTKTVSKKTKVKSFYYWCNCHEELASKGQKHSDISKQRNTKTYLTRYKFLKASEPYQEIISKKLDGFENIIVDQHDLYNLNLDEYNSNLDEHDSNLNEHNPNLDDYDSNASEKSTNNKAIELKIILEKKAISEKNKLSL
ncbi:15137_t:CDS:2 [Racocetra persica]|uniref:15137_t:CDS:1 n=1 Tax=Racocetra persica TaxID=160502 RepID=A0ACA9KGA3_9GLOM|nr:15137_t:CDS:2 [Racocetra persica]